MTLKVGDCVKVLQPNINSHYILKVTYVDTEDNEVMGARWYDDKKKWGAADSELGKTANVVKLDVCPDAGAVTSAGRRRTRRNRRSRRKTRARKSRRYRK